MSGDGVGNGVVEFWISGWDPEGYPLKDDTVIKVFATNNKPNKYLAFHVIEFSAYEAVVKERDEVIIARDILIKDWPEALAKMALMSGEIDQLLQDRKNLMDEVEVLKAEIEQCGAHR